ncbi:MAG TPA: redoxin domain-containing protein [Solirubrobacteraceae bacterium]|nr:redoxin domain-containing protein [Solirubrobacteraceae bacterium]
MDVLITTAFAVLAGAATALSPCVLPVLPVALAAGSTGGRRRPLGVAIGLAGAFALAAVLLTRALDALGLPGDSARGLAIAVLAAFGIALVVPRLGAALEGRLSRLGRRGAGAGRGDGFRSGLVLGASLGLVYAPCAGPILAAVVALDAAVSAERLALGFAYGIGAAVALLAVMTLGRSLTGRLAPYAGRLQQGFGVVMVTVAVLLAAGVDRDFQAAIADDLPAVVVNPSGELEQTGAVRRSLVRVRGGEVAPRREQGAALLDDDGPAPEFTGIARWIGAPRGQEPRMGALRGRVVLLDFWTYSCINCLRTLSHLRAWDDRYRAAGLTIVGVHTPEFAFERRESNVRAAIAANRLRYPVALDNDYGTWNAWGNLYWPAKYLVDARGHVRYWHFGEGEYDRTEQAIRALLAEAGRAPDSDGAESVAAERAAHGVTTPETYLGWERAARFVERPQPGTRDFGDAQHALDPDQFALRGTWTIEDERARAGPRARIDARVGARRVFLVMGSPDRARNVRVLVEGRPVRTVRVQAQRLYRLLDFGRVKRRLVTLELDPGVAAYAFTFG